MWKAPPPRGNIQALLNWAYRVLWNAKFVAWICIMDIMKRHNNGDRSPRWSQHYPQVLSRNTAHKKSLICCVGLLIVQDHHNPLGWLGFAYWRLISWTFKRWIALFSRTTLFYYIYLLQEPKRAYILNNYSLTHLLWYGHNNDLPDSTIRPRRGIAVLFVMDIIYGLPIWYTRSILSLWFLLRLRQ